MNEDPLASLIDRAYEAGWHLAPQIGLGLTNALVYLGEGFCDVVTIPLSGPSIVLRRDMELGHSRRSGREQWRHVVPIRLALDWVVSGTGSDEMLTDPRGEFR